MKILVAIIAFCFVGGITGEHHGHGKAGMKLKGLERMWETTEKYHKAEDKENWMKAEEELYAEMSKRLACHPASPGVNVRAAISETRNHVWEGTVAMTELNKEAWMAMAGEHTGKLFEKIKCHPRKQASEDPHSSYQTLQDHLVYQLTNSHYYNKNQRPQHTKNDTTTVGFGLTIVHLHLHTETEPTSLTGVVWMKMGWEDHRLEWEPHSWGGIEQLHLPANSVWTPDIVPFSSIDADSFSHLHSSVHPKVVVESSGSVLTVIPVRVNSPCPHKEDDDVNDWECHVKFGSWVHREKDLDIQPTMGGCDTHYLKNKQVGNGYHFKACGEMRRAKVYPCCPDTYVSMKYSFAFDHPESE